jgi:HSP20 family protein
MMVGSEKVAVEHESNPLKPVWRSQDENEKNMSIFRYRIGSRSYKWRPPTDVYENQDAIIVRVEIAGMRDSDFSITLNDRVLTIEGVRPDQSERRAYHQMEIRFGEFKTEVLLHVPVDSQTIQAEYLDGILRLVLPKIKPHQIQIGK